VFIPGFGYSGAAFMQSVAFRQQWRARFDTVQPSQARKGSPNQTRSSKMNVLKNMEAIFLAAVVLAGFSTYASAAIPAAHLASKALVSVQGESKMAVVTVIGKRMSAAEKAASL
jgi:hypothetical protein